MIEIVVTKTINTAYLGPIEAGCAMVVPDHTAKRLIGAGFAELRIVDECECTCVDCGDGGIVAEFAEDEED